MGAYIDYFKPKEISHSIWRDNRPTFLARSKQNLCTVVSVNAHVQRVNPETPTLSGISGTGKVTSDFDSESCDTRVEKCNFQKIYEFLQEERRENLFTMANTLIQRLVSGNGLFSKSNAAKGLIDSKSKQTYTKFENQNPNSSLDSEDSIVEFVIMGSVADTPIDSENKYLKAFSLFHPPKSNVNVNSSGSFFMPGMSLAVKYPVGTFPMLHSSSRGITCDRDADKNISMNSTAGASDKNICKMFSGLNVVSEVAKEPGATSTPFCARNSNRKCSKSACSYNGTSTFRNCHGSLPSSTCYTVNFDHTAVDNTTCAGSNVGFSTKSNTENKTSFQTSKEACNILTSDDAISVRVAPSVTELAQHPSEASCNEERSECPSDCCRVNSNIDCHRLCQFYISKNCSQTLSNQSTPDDKLTDSLKLLRSKKARPSSKKRRRQKQRQNENIDHPAPRQILNDKFSLFPKRINETFDVSKVCNKKETMSKSTNCHEPSPMWGARGMNHLSRTKRCKKLKDDVHFTCQITDDKSTDHGGFSGHVSFILSDIDSDDSQDGYSSLDCELWDSFHVENDPYNPFNFQVSCLNTGMKKSTSSPEMSSGDLFTWHVEVCANLNKSDSNQKQVHFASEEALVTEHECVGPEEDRKGPWEEYARDRCRFERRIEEVEGAISYCFKEDHRRKCYQQIYCVIT